MRYMCMIRQNKKGLSRCITVLLLFYICVGTVYAREKRYSYQLDDTLRIYDRGKSVMECPEYLVQQSSLAFVWKNESGYCYYIKETHEMKQKLDWAYTILEMYGQEKRETNFVNGKFWYGCRSNKSGKVKQVFDEKKWPMPYCLDQVDKKRKE